MWGIFQVRNINNQQPPKKSSWGAITSGQNQKQRGGTVVSSTEAEVNRAKALAKMATKKTSNGKRPKTSKTTVTKSTKKGQTKHKDTNKHGGPSWRDV